MRVLHLYDHTEPLQSGYVFRSQTLRTALEGRGIICDILSGVRHFSSNQLPYTRNEIINDKIYHRTKPHNISLPVIKDIADIWVMARHIVTLLKKNHYDIIHAHSPLLNIYAALLARKMAGQPHIKIVYEIRAFWEDAAVDHGTTHDKSLRYKTTYWLETKACHLADHIYPICEGLQNDLVRRGIPAKKMTIIQNVINPMEFKPETASSDLFMTRYNIAPTDIILGFIGSFYAYEGLEDFIPVMKSLITRNPHYKLLLVGGGSAEKNIRQTINEHQLQSHIIFTGRVPHKEINEHYALCKAMIYPRRSMRLTETTTPLKPLEAMAAGKVIFLSNIGGHRELVRDKETGFFLNNILNPEETAQYMIKILEDENLCQKVKQAGRSYVENERTAQIIALKYYNF